MSTVKEYEAFHWYARCRNLQCFKIVENVSKDTLDLNVTKEALEVNYQCPFCGHVGMDFVFLFPVERPKKRPWLPSIDVLHLKSKSGQTTHKFCNMIEWQGSRPVSQEKRAELDERWIKGDQLEYSRVSLDFWGWTYTDDDLRAVTPKKSLKQRLPKAFKRAAKKTLKRIRSIMKRWYTRFGRFARRLWAPKGT